MDYKEKVQLAEEVIRRCLGISKNPICLMSFGKDSLVVYDLIKKKIPILFLKEPFLQHRYDFAQRVISKKDLEVHSYPPTVVDYVQIEDYFEIFNFFSIGQTDKLMLHSGCKRKVDGEFVCGVDFLNRPTVPSYSFRWDCVFSGVKNSDRHNIVERMAFESIERMGQGTMVKPLVDWHDDDVWRYIKENNVEYDKERYDNNKEDVIPTCYECLDYRNSPIVVCPQTGKEVLCRGKSKEQNQECVHFIRKNFYRKVERTAAAQKEAKK